MAKTQFSPSNSKLSYKRLLAAVAALIVFFLLLTSVIGLAEKYVALHKRTREIKAQQAVLKEKERDLMELNAYLATVDGQQQSLRAKFNVVKPGEEMIVITVPLEPQAAPMAPKTGFGHWWQTILQGLGIQKS